MRTRVFVVDDIEVLSTADKIEIQQGDQSVFIGGGARVQDLINALLTVNWGLQQSRRVNEIRKQREMKS